MQKPIFPPGTAAGCRRGAGGEGGGRKSSLSSTAADRIELNSIDGGEIKYCN